MAKTCGSKILNDPQCPIAAGHKERLHEELAIFLYHPAEMLAKILWIREYDEKEMFPCHRKPALSSLRGENKFLFTYRIKTASVP